MSESAPDRERKCRTEKDSEVLGRGSKRICLPIARAEHDHVLADPVAFRQCLDGLVGQYPELFPKAMGAGYTLHDILPASQKMPNLRLRRIQVTHPENPNGEVFTIAPSFVLPYMTGYTDDVEKASFLRGEFGVPYWGLTHVFGHTDMYWERLELGLGRNSIVGTTVKQPDQLPQNLLADEKHTRLHGATVYIATTVGADCILGASVALHANEKDLTDAYQQFKVTTQPASHRTACSGCKCCERLPMPHSAQRSGWAARRLRSNTCGAVLPSLCDQLETLRRYAAQGDTAKSVA